MDLKPTPPSLKRRIHDHLNARNPFRSGLEGPPYFNCAAGE